MVITRLSSMGRGNSPACVLHWHTLYGMMSYVKCTGERHNAPYVATSHKGWLGGIILVSVMICFSILDFGQL